MEENEGKTKQNARRPGKDQALDKDDISSPWLKARA
jgi:hypothetical protein